MTLGNAFNFVRDNSPRGTLVNVKLMRSVWAITDGSVMRHRVYHVDFKLPHMRMWGHAFAPNLDLAVQNAMERIESNLRNHHRKVSRDLASAAGHVLATVC